MVAEKRSVCRCCLKWFMIFCTCDRPKTFFLYRINRYLSCEIDAFSWLWRRTQRKFASYGKASLQRSFQVYQEKVEAEVCVSGFDNFLRRVYLLEGHVEDEKQR